MRSYQKPWQHLLQQGWIPIGTILTYFSFAAFGMCLYILAFLMLRFNIAVSVLPEDDWFNDMCQEATERLSGKPKAINGDRDLSSPTASVSAQSISSIRSHGSS